MSGSDDISDLSFEAALQRLESGDAPLEAAITLYEDAQALRAHCEAKLSAAEARISQLQLDRDGNPVSEAPFPG